jgi:hypothetical protein
VCRLNLKKERVSHGKSSPEKEKNNKKTTTTKITNLNADESSTVSVKIATTGRVHRSVI